MAGTPSDPPCCLVMDSSAMMSENYDMHEFFSKLLPSSPHVVVIPRNVVDELYGLQRCAKGTVSIRAEDLLHVLKTFPEFQQRGPAHADGPAPVQRRKGGYVVRQKPKETYYPAEKFARNPDTHIVACAYYFTMGRGALKRPVDSTSQTDTDPFSSAPTSTDSLRGLPQAPSHARRASSSTFAAQLFGCHRGFFVTDDLVQELRASAYNIPTISTTTLKRHFGHLGTYEL